MCLWLKIYGVIPVNCLNVVEDFKGADKYVCVLVCVHVSGEYVSMYVNVSMSVHVCMCMNMSCVCVCMCVWVYASAYNENMCAHVFLLMCMYIHRLGEVGKAEKFQLAMSLRTQLQ
jgi:hypothetical protein